MGIQDTDDLTYDIDNAVAELYKVADMAEIIIEAVFNGDGVTLQTVGNSMDVFLTQLREGIVEVEMLNEMMSSRFSRAYDARDGDIDRHYRQQSADEQEMEVDTMEERKVFYTAADIASDLSISEREAADLVRELNKRLRVAGKIVVTGRVPAAWYKKHRESGFMDVGQQAEHIPLTERRILGIKEFCCYSGLGRDAAYKFGERAGITKRNGTRILFDRVLFDEWCNENRSADL